MNCIIKSVSQYIIDDIDAMKVWMNQYESNPMTN